MRLRHPGPPTDKPACPRCGSNGTPRRRVGPRLLFLIVFGVLVLLRAVSMGVETNWWTEDPKSDGGGSCFFIGIAILVTFAFGSVVHSMFGPHRRRRRCPECFVEIED